MDYKLAKELKDSGFPKSEDWGEHSTLMKGNYFMVDGYGVPKLSELIEACGTMQLNVYDDAGYSQALSNKMMGEGKTPEDAVARLWLALNKVDIPLNSNK